MHAAYLQNINPPTNKWRFYRISVTPTLFGTWAVIREWGRIGTAGQSKEDWFETVDAAKADAKRLCVVKQNRGYTMQVAEAGEAVIA